MSSKRWLRSLFLFVPVLLVLSGLAVGYDLARSSPAIDQTNALSLAIKDGDDVDNSGHGSDHDDDESDDDHSGHGGNDHDDDDGQGDVARPVIPPDDYGDVVIEIIDERFVPAEVTIDAGQRVTFINLDDDEHTATGIGFDTGTLEPGDWRTVPFERGGEAPFTCQFHPEMLGSVTVRGGVGSPVAFPMASPLAVTPVAGSSTATEITVSIVDFAFESPELEISAGTTVIWVNNGAAVHTVTGQFGDSGVLQPGQSFSFAFNDAGDFDYVCQFHPQMTGRIVVT